MKIRKLIAAGLAAMSLSFGAQAAVLLFQDDDIDFALNPDLSVKTSGTLAVGDILVAVFEMPTFTIGGVNGIPAGQELTGVSAIQIASITPVVVQDPLNPAGPPLGIINVIAFEAPDVGLNAILALGGGPSVDQGGAQEGATVAMWFNGTGPTAPGTDRDLILDFAENPASNCTSLADCIDQASRGDLAQVDGFAGDLDERWVAQTSLANPNALDVAAVRGSNNSLLAASFNLALTNFFNSETAGGEIGWMNIATGNPCPAGNVGADGCVRGPTGSGTVTGGEGLVNGAFAHSDFDARKLSEVPEPGTVVLLGIGLLALASLRRRV